MDGDVPSLSSSSPLSSAAGTQKDTSPKCDSSLPQNQQEHKSTQEIWYVRVLYVPHFYIQWWTQKQEH